MIDRSGWRTAGARKIAPLLCGAWVVGTVLPAAADLGWQEAEYIKSYGVATRSPLTPNEAQFTLKGGQLLVAFDGGRSREEAWVVDSDPGIIPAPLIKLASAAVKSTPARRVTFKLKDAPAADIFESQLGDTTLVVDSRGGVVRRVVQCRGKSCTFPDRLMKTEMALDDLLWRAQKSDAHR